MSGVKRMPGRAGRQVRFHPTQLQHCIHDREEAICFCSEREQKQTCKQTGTRGTGIDEVEEGGSGFGRDKAVCGQSRQRSDHLLRDVCLFACLCGRGWGESHNVSQRESALLLLNFCATERPVVGNAS